MFHQVGVTVGGNKKEFQCLSTDTKLIIDIGDSSTAYELNTGKGWIFDSKNLNPTTNSYWWEV